MRAWCETGEGAEQSEIKVSGTSLTSRPGIASQEGRKKKKVQMSAKPGNQDIHPLQSSCLVLGNKTQWERVTKDAPEGS